MSWFKRKNKLSIDNDNKIMDDFEKELESIYNLRIKIITTDGGYRIYSFFDEDDRFHMIFDIKELNIKCFRECLDDNFGIRERYNYMFNTFYKEYIRDKKLNEILKDE